MAWRPYSLANIRACPPRFIFRTLSVISSLFCLFFSLLIFLPYFYFLFFF
ncbi:unnamed protein product [Meloidogyne enterolobii]|uniref:Uncharacterized protein n=1 Tax=Meloidogyne enterolobii TaxID=390850 RepID=A0ACB0Z3C0_MELEN